MSSGASSRQLAESGLSQALDRLTEELLSGSDSALIPFAESLSWLYSLHEWHRKVGFAENVNSLPIPAVVGASPAMPEPRLIKNPQDAEALARDLLAELGFEAVEVTPAGRDGGVDVRGPAVVAQVKLEGVKTDSTRLQALTGIAAIEKKQAAFFSLSGYSAASLAWAERVDMALFEFDYSGEILPRSSVAERLMRDRQQRPGDDGVRRTDRGHVAQPMRSFRLASRASPPPPPPPIQPSCLGPSQPAPPNSAEGWYRDPWGIGKRWWDGQHWTPHVLS